MRISRQVELTGRTQELSGRGEVYTFSTMYNVPKGFEEYAPYTIAIVKLDEGPMVTTQLTDVNHDEVRIGMRVEMVTRRLKEDGSEGQIIYGYKFRPVLERST
jgi:hypothetical protein